MKKGSMKMSSEGRDLNEEKEQENKYLRSECCCFFFLMNISHQLVNYGMKQTEHLIAYCTVSKRMVNTEIQGKAFLQKARSRCQYVGTVMSQLPKNFITFPT